MPGVTWLQKYGAILIGAGALLIQVIGGLIALGMILQQIADLRANVQELQMDRLDQTRSVVRSETRLDGIDHRLASMERLLGQLVQQKLGSLP